jgi:hypothetical protein
VLERTQDSSFGSKVKLHLAKALRLFYLIYASTRKKLLERIHASSPVWDENECFPGCEEPIT